ncbi:ATP-binding cassette domain-containing protein [Actinomadura darangshiensis]|uniref:ATP-binding cassette domain-containing protein n=1 Tax=Actinomadura darangshiensis TaxID=705336 RepID=A0A4R5AWE6_9ACTN|nr:ATP-binding cassette domain-containing protein [Actinomadura darangshiensis]TDD77788.1 ATP-binding cassette domain-containing protein [Actinomadura darangshiensis]
MAEPIIEADGLVRRFGKVEALAGLDLTAHSGQVTAVLGPNGAGKTTFVRTVATLVRPEAGRLRVAGVDAARHPGRVRQIIGLAGQYAAVEPTMTGRENLRMVARLYGRSRRQAAGGAQEVLARLGLEDVADRRVATYSGGLRRRLDLGATLVGAPRLLLLDEPTTGLDPRSRNHLWDAIRDLVARGTDVLLTTQYLDEADQLAHQVAIIDHGRVIAHGRPAELKARAGRDMIEVRARHPADLPALVRALAPVGAGEPRVDAGTGRVAVPAAGGPRALTAAVRALGDLGLAVDDIALRRPTLDEVFLTLTGGPSRPGGGDRPEHAPEHAGRA